MSGLEEVSENSAISRIAADLKKLSESVREFYRLPGNRDKAIFAYIIRECMQVHDIRSRKELITSLKNNCVLARTCVFYFTKQCTSYSVNEIVLVFKEDNYNSIDRRIQHMRNVLRSPKTNKELYQKATTINISINKFLTELNLKYNGKT